MNDEVFQQNLDDEKKPTPRRTLSHPDAVQRAGIYALAKMK